MLYYIQLLKKHARNSVIPQEQHEAVSLSTFPYTIKRTESLSRGKIFRGVVLTIHSHLTPMSNKV